MIRKQEHNRRSIRLPDYNYAQPGAYFFTAVSYQRSPIFSDEAIHAIVMGTWLSLPQRFHGISLDGFIVMPNHVHGIVIINDVGAGSPRPSASDLYQANASGPPTLGEKYRILQVSGS